MRRLRSRDSNPRPRHYEVREPVRLARGEQRNDVRLLEPGGELDFARETLGGEVGAQDLHNDVALERRIAGKEDAAHPAATELALEGVDGAERGLELVAELFGHGVVATRAPRGARRCAGRLREGSIAAGARKHGGERPLPHRAAEVWASPLRADRTVNFAQVSRGLSTRSARRMIANSTRPALDALHSATSTPKA
jgi:hypothetical protein